MLDKHNRNQSSFGYESDTRPTDAQLDQSDQNEINPYISTAFAEAEATMVAVDDVLRGTDELSSLGDMGVTHDDPEVKFAVDALKNPAESASTLLHSTKTKILTRVHSKLNKNLQHLADYRSDPYSIEKQPEIDEKVRKSRFGMLPYVINEDLFGGREKYDDVDADPAGKALCSIYGIKGGNVPSFIDGEYDFDPEKMTPLAAEDIDQLVEAIPLMIGSAEYKLARWGDSMSFKGPKALSNAGFLLARIGEVAPEEVIDINIKEVIADLKLLIASANFDVKTSVSGSRVEENATCSKEDYQKCLDVFLYARAIQLQQEAKEQSSS